MVKIKNNKITITKGDTLLTDEELVAKFGITTNTGKRR